MLNQALFNHIIGKLALFLWTFAQPDNIAADNAILPKTIQFVLTDLCSKCQQNAFFQPKYKRSFWIDHAVPILQPFVDQSHLIGFNGARFLPKTTLNSSLIQIHQCELHSVKCHNGVEYSDNGHSCLGMESSSISTLIKDIDHTQDDTIKTL